MIYYFGCLANRMGHYFADESGEDSGIRPPAGCPWKSVDGALAHIKDGVWSEGAAVFHQYKNWSAIAFADNSVDDRGASNAVFFTDEPVPDAETLLIRAASRYPKLFDRFRVAPMLARICVECKPDERSRYGESHQLTITGDCDGAHLCKA